MPPSTHYLNLLNLNQVEDPSQQIDYTNEDIAKELELFTNTNFLDFEPFYPQAHGQAAFGQQFLDPATQQQQQHQHQPIDEKPKMQNSTLPRNQRPQFQPYMEQAPLTANPHLVEQPIYEQPLPQKRTAEVAGHDQTATPSPNVSHNDEEDKRRRNTAASARFRIKKKQREQALLESAKQMTDKNTALENRIKELEMENKWLRSLLKPVSTDHIKHVGQGL